MVKDITTFADYNALIKGNSKFVVDFHATWCGPCRVVAPKVDELAKKYSNGVFVKVDVDQVPYASHSAQIRAMPTFQIFKGGKKVDEVVGADVVKLEAAIKKADV
ncbi:thioredoxin [Chytridium lagenaria]|nr:thioredoxin [Chytridium lagenaria]